MQGLYNCIPTSFCHNCRMPTRTTHLIWNEQDDGGSLGRPGAHAHVLDERAELERRLDLAERDVLAHLKLDQILPAVDDPESSVRHRLKVENGA